MPTPSRRVLEMRRPGQAPERARAKPRLRKYPRRIKQQQLNASVQPFSHCIRDDKSRHVRSQTRAGLKRRTSRGAIRAVFNAAALVVRVAPDDMDPHRLGSPAIGVRGLAHARSASWFVLHRHTCWWPASPVLASGWKSSISTDTRHCRSSDSAAQTDTRPKEGATSSVLVVARAGLLAGYFMANWQRARSRRRVRRRSVRSIPIRFNPTPTISRRKTRWTSSHPRNLMIWPTNPRADILWDQRTGRRTMPMRVGHNPEDAHSTSIKHPWRKSLHCPPASKRS